MKLLTRQKLVVPAAIVMSLVLAPMLAGCSGNPIQGIIKNATGGQVDVGGTQIPEDFPTDVPLATGAIISAANFGNDDGKVWSVAIKVPSSSAIDDITSQLTEAGFSTAGSTSNDKGSSSIFAKEPYGVLVVVAKADEGGFVANYTVTYTKPGS